MKVIEITTRIGCKISCEYCPQKILMDAYSKRSNIYEMSVDTFKRCVDKIPQDTYLLFCGMSEPWLNLNCKEMVLYAHQKGYKIGMETTLVGMSLSDVESIKPVPFEYFALHLPSGEKYEKITVDENYLKLLETVSQDIKAKMFHYHYYGETLHPKLKISNTWRIPLFSRCGNIKIKEKALPEKARGIIGCTRMLHWNVLLPNGDVLLCSSDYGMKHILGNLLTADYDSLFSGTPFSNVKKGLWNGSSDVLCRYCETYSYKRSLFKTHRGSSSPFVSQV